MGKNVYEMKVYGVFYHKEADTADEAREKLAEELSERHGSPVPASHVKLVHTYRGGKKRE